MNVIRREKRPAHRALAAALVIYWAALMLGSQFTLDPPGVLYDVWYSAVPLVFGWLFAFGVALYIARWWVLLAALTPILVLGVLELAGHRSPWHDPGPPLTQYGWWFVFWSLFWFFVLPLLLGVSIRRGLGQRGSDKLPAVE